MIIADEDALICDFAETYGIYNYKRLPLRTAAVLASGLREDSRIMMKLSGMNVTPNTLLNATIADRVGLLAWMQTKDGAKGRNRPESIAAKLLNTEKNKEKAATFRSGKEFDKEWKRLAERRK